VKAGVSIEELAEDIARRGLLQGLSVRPVIDQAGVETGMFEIPAGGRRFRALELLVKQKRLAKTAPVPCIVREGGIAEEDSLAENVQRAPLHPLDQFRAFLALREKGQSEEEIAAAFFVSVNVVKQRLKLASVSPRLLDVYAEDGMTLDQLMAFTVSGDHDRQEQVFERLKVSYDKQPYTIRRMLTEGAVRASDKRAQFIGLDAYVAAGGVILRDLFQGDDGGWLQDVALIDQMVADKLKAESEADPTADDDAVRAMAASYDGGDVQITAEPITESEEDEGLSPLSDRLMAELTAHRTLGLRHALGERPDVAFLAALHALTLKTFYHYGSDSCLELDLKSVSFAAQSPGLNDSASVQAIRLRHESWAKALPKESVDLWAALQDWDGDSRAGLLAHVVSLSVNAVHESWNRRPRALAHADHLAQAVDLDMAAAGWTPTVDNFLGRVTKARILQAVAEAKGQRAADRIEHLKKGEMAAEAETLLANTGWLPEPLRTPGQGTIADAPPTESAAEETAEKPSENKLEDEDEPSADNGELADHVMAAE
jgi:ParB/RepB/Spo0J family partition protein